VEGFAIGGHCQYLLVMDYVLAARDAYLTLPARKEGIIPGAANCACRASSATASRDRRSWRKLRIECDSAEGRLICDEVVAQSEMDGAIERV